MRCAVGAGAERGIQKPWQSYNQRPSVIRTARRNGRVCSKIGTVDRHHRLAAHLRLRRRRRPSHRPGSIRRVWHHCRCGAAVRIVGLVGWSAPIFVVTPLLFWLEVRLGMQLVTSGIWWHLLGPGIAACFQATILTQLTNRPAAAASDLDWRTAGRHSARRVAAIHHAQFTLIVGYLLIWLVLSRSIFGHSHIGGFAWIPAYFPPELAAAAWAIGLGAAHTYFLPVLATATLVVGLLYIVVHLLLDIGVAWAGSHREKPDDAEANGIARITGPLPRGPSGPNAFPAMPCFASLHCPEYDRWPNQPGFPASFLEHA